MQLHVIARCVLWRCIGACNGRVNPVQLARLDMPFAVFVFGAGNLAGFDRAQDRGSVQAPSPLRRGEGVGHGVAYHCGECCAPQCAAMVNFRLGLAGGAGIFLASCLAIDNRLECATKAGHNSDPNFFLPQFFLLGVHGLGVTSSNRGMPSWRRCAAFGRAG
jgi:hypothetical protein